ncbi:hypothetical protein [Nannocystis sp. SCPEA4]|uniref:hypothetical protein n=1 Tax=Nannocystis sp. SCPEA4 TaxID=2996787 RepID=UPI00226DA2CC|nr:hypothetical protein [Nannocystis sp. SCPEA4]MCY1059504.1 hypothetical protein [Nannocystis sp. SCPEA4]
MRDQLASAISAVHRRCDEFVRDPLLDAAQSELLLAFLARAREAGGPENPSALPLLVGMAECGRANVDLVAGCSLHAMALRRFDAVARRDLDAPWDDTRAPIAGNTALALHMLAVDAIAAAVPASRTEAARLSLRRHSLRAVAARHRDASGTIAEDEAGVRSHEADRSSAFALSAELAAIAAGCEPERVAAHCRIGEATAQIQQIAADLRELFSTGRDPDVLRYPSACFAARASAAERAEMARLRAEPQVDRDAIRRLLLAGPAVRACTATLEAARRQVHAEILALFPAGSPLDLHREFVDSVAAGPYRRSHSSDLLNMSS